MTKIIEIKATQNQAPIKKAAEIIRERGVVIYPTETCYGLGVDATEPGVIGKVYEVKNRDKGKPISIVVSGVE